MKKYLVLILGISLFMVGCATTSTTMSSISLKDSVVVDREQQWDLYVECGAKAKPRSWIHSENLNAGAAVLVGGIIGAGIQAAAEDGMDSKVTKSLLAKYNLDEKEILQKEVKSTFAKAGLPELNYVKSKKAGHEDLLLFLEIKRSGVRLTKEGDAIEGEKVEAFIEADAKLVNKSGETIQWEEFFLVTSSQEYVLEEIKEVLEVEMEELIESLAKKIMYSLKYPT